MELLTCGHGTADATELTRLLLGAGVRQVVDVRSVPGSRRNPDVAGGAMPRWLARAGIGYRWEGRLGGWRKRPHDSPDTALRNRSFGGYAGHMRSPEFVAAVDDLLADAGERRTTVLCAESVWWRCHRKLIADFVVIARGTDVRHLMHDGTLRPHRPSSEARLLRGEGLLVYDASQVPPAES